MTARFEGKDRGVCGSEVLLRHPVELLVLAPRKVWTGDIDWALLPRCFQKHLPRGLS